MRGLGELRVKESDRIALMAAGLAACGVAVEEEPEGLIVAGAARANHRSRRRPASHTHGDHRIAMAHLVLGLAAEQPVSVDEPGMIATSFPGFVDADGAASARIEAAMSGLRHRRRRAGRLGQGHHRRTAWRALFGLPVLDIGPALPRRRGRRCSGPAAISDDAAGAGGGGAARSIRSSLDDPALRTRAAGEAASRVAAHPGVREALLRLPARLRRPGRAGR